MRKAMYSLGLDFSTNSVRAMMVDTAAGAERGGHADFSCAWKAMCAPPP